MSATDIPLWAAWLVVTLAIGGATLSLISALGLARLTSFYERAHAPSIVTVSGVTLILLASIVFFSVAEGRPVLRDALIGLFVVITTPVTTILLVRAAVYRDRIGEDDAPSGP